MGCTHMMICADHATRKYRKEVFSGVAVLVTAKAGELLCAVVDGNGINDLALRVTVNDLRELDIENLLGRDPVPPSQELLSKNIRGKSVLVTGAGGSVVPLFRKQIAAGGLVTVTHAEITRYFITIPEAAQLAIRAGTMAQGGKVFVLNMCDPEKFVDLAWRMIELSGLSVRSDDNPGGHIEIEVVGLRPAEKLYKELLIGDNLELTFYTRIMKAWDEFVPWAVLRRNFMIMSNCVTSCYDDLLLRVLSETVPKFTPT